MIHWQYECGTHDAWLLAVATTAQLTSTDLPLDIPINLLNQSKSYVKSI
jgi:hypothetical protein